MKKHLNILCLTLIICLVSSIQAFAAPTFSLSPSTSSVAPNGTFTVTITGIECVGRVNMSASNGTLSHSEVWVENSSASVTVTAGSSGSVTITATPDAATGMSDLDGNEINPGSRTATVTIIAPQVKPSEGSSSSSSSNSSSSSSGYSLYDMLGGTPVNSSSIDMISQLLGRNHVETEGLIYSERDGKTVLALSESQWELMRDIALNVLFIPKLGIGGTFSEGTCGAVTGAVMALGFLGADEKQIISASKKLFNEFKDKYESVTCGYISKDGDDKSPCVEVCLFAGEKVCEYLKE